MKPPPRTAKLFAINGRDEHHPVCDQPSGAGAGRPPWPAALSPDRTPDRAVDMGRDFPDHGPCGTGKEIKKEVNIDTFSEPAIVVPVVDEVKKVEKKQIARIDLDDILPSKVSKRRLNR